MGNARAFLLAFCIVPSCPVALTNTNLIGAFRIEHPLLGVSTHPLEVMLSRGAHGAIASHHVAGVRRVVEEIRQ